MVFQLAYYMTVSQRTAAFDLSPSADAFRSSLAARQTLRRLRGRPSPSLPARKDRDRQVHHLGYS